MRTFACTVCGYTYTEAIDKLPPVTTDEKPETEAPDPDTDEPSTQAPETEAPTTDAPAVTTYRSLSDLERPSRDDKTPASDEDGNSAMLAVVAVLGVCLLGAVVVLIVVVVKKKK